MREAVTLSTLLTDIGSIVSAALGWVTDVVSAITGNPLILLFVIFGFVGTGIGIFKRLTR